MKNMNPPQLDAITVYETIKNKSNNTKKLKKRDRLENLKSYVLLRYDDYETDKKNLEKIVNSNITDEFDKKAFNSCYTRRKNGYLEGAVVKDIINIQSIQHKNTCPYCGIDKPRTIDHYLPKSDYPEFAIYPPNLIPCCGYCNTKKSDRWINKGKRLFINFYFDNIPAERFLFTDLVFDSNKQNQIPTVSFTIINTGNINSKIFEIITSHFKELNLLKEYSEYVALELSSIHDKISHSTNYPVGFHKSNLQESLNGSIRMFGFNYWQSSLYDALIKSDEFFDRIYKLTK